MNIKIKLSYLLIFSCLICNIFYGSIQNSKEDMEKQLKELLSRRNLTDRELKQLGVGLEYTEKGAFGEQATKGKDWNFELQNKWEDDAIMVSLFEYIGEIKFLHLCVFLEPFEKVRTMLETTTKEIFIEIMLGKNKNILKTIKTVPPRSKESYYKTIYLTFGKDGFVYPQTGILKGLVNTTDSGLNNSNNISQGSIIQKWINISKNKNYVSNN